MVLRAVFLDFSGVIIKDLSLRRQLIDDILITENLRPNPAEFTQVCLGRSDRACLHDLLSERGRVTSKDYLDKLLDKRSAAYIQALSERHKLPLYPGLRDLLYQLKTVSLPIVLVAGTPKADAEWVLNRAGVLDQFALRITAEDISVEGDRPSGQIFETALARLNQDVSSGSIAPGDCLAVESSFAGITAAKQTGIPVVGVAHLYPYRMMQRQANWAVDYLNEIELSWINRWYDTGSSAAQTSSLDQPMA